MTLEGLVASHPDYPRGTLWFFEDKNSAIRARNLMEANGIKCGNNICSFTIAADGVPEFDKGQGEG